MLRWRLLLGTLFIALLVGLCWLDHRATIPGVWLLPLAILAVVLSTAEMLDLAGAVGLRPPAWPVYLANIAMVLIHWAAIPAGLPAAAGLGSSMIVLAVGLAVAFGVELHRYESPGRTIGALAGAGLAMLYVGLLFSILIHLRMCWGIGALASVLLVVKMGDIGAYAVGRLVGRHKMSPVISPGKTWEGAAGAILFGCLGAWLCFQWIVPYMSKETAATGIAGGWLIFGVLVAIAGMLGDLAESLLKRDAGRKDSSRWMPGFGGILDMVDSVLLAAPIAWLCWAAGLVGR